MQKIPKLSKTQFTPSPMSPIRGAKTMTDRAPMSTSKYSSHIRKYAKSK
jgi:hypothetical protein